MWMQMGICLSFLIFSNQAELWGRKTLHFNAEAGWHFFSLFDQRVWIAWNGVEFRFRRTDIATSQMMKYEHFWSWDFQALYIFFFATLWCTSENSRVLTNYYKIYAMDNDDYANLIHISIIYKYLLFSHFKVSEFKRYFRCGEREHWFHSVLVIIHSFQHINIIGSIFHNLFKFQFIAISLEGFFALAQRHHLNLF